MPAAPAWSAVRWLPACGFIRVGAWLSYVASVKYWSLGNLDKGGVGAEPFLAPRFRIRGYPLLATSNVADLSRIFYLLFIRIFHFICTNYSFNVMNATSASRVHWNLFWLNSCTIAAASFLKFGMYSCNQFAMPRKLWTFWLIWASEIPVSSRAGLFADLCFYPYFPTVWIVVISRASWYDCPKGGDVGLLA